MSKGAESHMCDQLLCHPRMNRRQAVQAGAIGLLGLGMNHVEQLRAESAKQEKQAEPARNVIFIFLSGGLAQHDSFDPKPNAPEEMGKTQQRYVKLHRIRPTLAAEPETLAARTARTRNG